MVLAAQTVIKYSKKMKNKYLSLVRRIGRNRAIVAIARILAETIFTMLKKNVDFEDEIIPLTEKKIKKMIERANSGSGEINIQESIKLISSKGFKSLSTKPFSWKIYICVSSIFRIFLSFAVCIIKGAVNLSLQVLL